jgi:hypothetical protein
MVGVIASLAGMAALMLGSVALFVRDWRARDEREQLHAQARYLAGELARERRRTATLRAMREDCLREQASAAMAALQQAGFRFHPLHGYTTPEDR